VRGEAVRSGGHTTGARQAQKANVRKERRKTTNATLDVCGELETSLQTAGGPREATRAQSCRSYRRLGILEGVGLAWRAGRTLRLARGGILGSPFRRG
jgi:hypothetical protein